MTEPHAARTTDQANGVMRAPYESRTVVGSGSAQSWGIAVEAPVEIRLNGEPWTVMLATPADLEELAIGLALTERVLRDAAHVVRVEIAEFLREISVDLVVSEGGVDREAVRKRGMAGATGCGLCGVESLAELGRGRGDYAIGQALSAIGDGLSAIGDGGVLRAFEQLPRYQPINAATRSVHAAAWCTTAGEIVLAREDVGRHNALDKLIGAMARRGLLRDNGFIVMTSRCSYELVAKTSRTAAQLLATISAPTTMALEWATELGISLVCCLRQDGEARVIHFPPEHPERNSSEAPHAA